MNKQFIYANTDILDEKIRKLNVMYSNEDIDGKYYICACGDWACMIRKRQTYTKEEYLKQIELQEKELENKIQALQHELKELREKK